MHGILLLRPLPPALDETRILRAIAPEKDVDGATEASLAAVYAGTGEGFAPCTAQAVLELLDHYEIPIEGKRAVILGRSLVVGRPAAMLLLHRGATVTLCHSKTGGDCARGGHPRRRDRAARERRRGVLFCGADGRRCRHTL